MHDRLKIKYDIIRIDCNNYNQSKCCKSNKNTLYKLVNIKRYKNRTCCFLDLIDIGCTPYYIESNCCKRQHEVYLYNFKPKIQNIIIQKCIDDNLLKNI